MNTKLLQHTLLILVLLLSLLDTLTAQQSSNNETEKLWLENIRVSEELDENVEKLLLSTAVSQNTATTLSYYQTVEQTLSPKENPLQFALVKFQIGLYHNQQQQFKQARVPLKQALELLDSTQFSQLYLTVLDGLTASCYWLFESEEAMQYATQGLNLAVKNNNLLYERKFLQWVGMVLVIQGRLEEALDYYRQVLKRSLAINDAFLKYEAYLNLACTNHKNKDSELGLFYLNYCTELLPQIEDNEKLQADVWMWGGIMQGANQEYEKGVELLKKAIPIFDQRNIPNRRMHTRLELGKIYLRQQQYRQTIKIVEEALQLDPKYITAFEQRFAYELLYRAYKFLGNYERAIYYLETLDSVVERLDSINNRKEINELEQKYKEQEQKRTIEQQEQLILSEGKKKKWLRITLGLLTLFLLVSFYVLYYLQKTRSKLSQQNTTIELQATELRRVDRMKSNFFTNITHEFRTPLTLILGMSEQIEASDKAKQLIQKNGKKLLHLINQLLDLSKLDAGKLQVNYQQMEVITLLRYIAESFQSWAERKHIELTVYNEVEHLLMDVDEEKLQQIFSNLLSNAIKFTPEYKEIVMHIAQKDNELLIEVKDKGIGIAATELPHIYNRFYQAEHAAVQHEKGTGVGLALVKELVELMEGRIEVKSVVGTGTAFTVFLPIRRNASLVTKDFQPLYVPIEEVESVTPFEPINKSQLPNLLLVEDNADVITYIQSLLQQQYNITIAMDGAEGIHQALQQIPDIIISDLMMPKKNGFEVVETLKKDEKTNHIPIILLTARATQADKIEGLKYGADAYLMKPFDKEELFVRLEQLIALRRQLQQKYHYPFLSNNEPATDLQVQFLQKLNQQIEEQLDNSNFSIEDFAASLNMSHTQFYRKIKALTDKTPSQYIRTVRLEKAKILLKNSSLTISEIAYEVGFSDPAYFTRTFTKEFNVSPSTFIEG